MAMLICLHIAILSMAAFAAQISSYERNHMANPTNAKIFSVWFLQNKLPIPALKYPYCSPSAEVAENVVYNYDL